MSRTPYRAGRCRAAAAGLTVPFVWALALPGTAAAHDECDLDTDVRLVVDDGPRHGGVTVHCIEDGAERTATELLRMAGVEVTWVRGRQGDVVCRLEGRPAGLPCTGTPPAGRSWALFYAAADDRSWTLANDAAGSVRAPGGGAVGWRIQDGAKLMAPAHVLTALPGTEKLGSGSSDPPDTSPDDQGSEGNGRTATLTGLLLITGLCVAGFLAVRRRP